jgi:NAD(P)-dependent dehydrogenase (short-subunit alcohol dehydrogenase family)
MVEQYAVPLGQVGTAEELAADVVFLVSPAASYISGTQIVVDGAAMPTV